MVRDDFLARSLCRVMGKRKNFTAETDIDFCRHAVRSRSQAKGRLQHSGDLALHWSPSGLALGNEA